MDALKVILQSDLQGFLLTGSGSSKALQTDGLPQPEQMLTAREHKGALVARTGRDEYLVFLPSDQPPPTCDWCFHRGDRVLSVTGADWRELMARVCQFDFRRFAPGAWLMASVAGVNCWIYHTLDEDTVFIGVSDGFHRYLEDVFKHLICELKDTDNTEGAAQ